MDSTDVLVIGGGVAGAAAALAAAAAGARTTLVRAGPGATALAAGGWTDAPPDPLRAALVHAGVELAPATAPLPHPDGHVVACAVAPLSHAAAGLAAGDAATERALICGIAGLPGYRPAALAALWSDAAALPADSLEPLLLTLADTPAAGWAPLSLAALLEREPRRLAEPLARAVRERGATRVIVPPVLGADGHAAVHAAVQEQTGVPVAEALGAAPSLPGWRLDRALLRALAAAGVGVIAGRVTAHTLRDDRVSFVSLTGRDGVTSITASAIVLATGKFIGGGIAAEPRFTEVALGSDVTMERFGRTFADARAALALSDPVRSEPQPILGAGVATDAEGHPLRAAGDVAAHNVVVAGSVRAGTETASLGLGAAAQDGWRAGTRAAAAAAAP